MKFNKILFGTLVSGIAMAGLTQSCVSDEPFDSATEGMLRMQLVVNSNLTRAEIGEEDLLSSCVVYVSNPNGLLHKYEGMAEVPEQLPLKFGSYVLEAWAGDSVPASFTQKFYRGYMPFKIEDTGVKNVKLECRIANVVVTVDKASITQDMLTDWKVKVFNSTGDLIFDENTEDDAKGYFMMSSADLAKNGESVLRDAEGWELYTGLFYTLEGTAADGSHFSTTGPIAGNNGYVGNIVEHAHEYNLKFEYNPNYEDQGGSMIVVKVDDTMPEVNYEIGLYSRPSVKGVGFDITDQIRGEYGAFDTNIVRVGAFNGVKSLQLYSTDPVNLPVNGADLMKVTGSQADDIRSRGIEWNYTPKGATEVSVCYVRLTDDFLNKLEERENEYVINFKVEDGNGRSNEVPVRIAVGKAAVKEKDPISIDDIAALNAADLLAIRSNRATITGSINSDEVENPKLLYRKLNESVWNEVDVKITRAAGDRWTAELTGLQPDTHYELAVKSGGLVYQAGQEFSTEKQFAIPYADMETWNMYNNKIAFPGTTYDEFWDSGNHGSNSIAVVGRNITTQSSDYFNSGKSSAFLKSQFVGLGSSVGQLAAGNLFAGKFMKTQGTTGAELTFGRPYDGSHPDALEVYVRYSPAEVNYSKTDALKKGETDQCQIFVAFANKGAHIDTSKSIYFNPQGSTQSGYDYEIYGYGQVTYNKEIGSSAGMEKVTIPIDWYDSAKKNESKYIIIVCSASKYGDFFTGAEGSALYVDDFKLIYK